MGKGGHMQRTATSIIVCLIIGIIAIIFLSGTLMTGTEQVEKELRDILKKQQDAWNQNNIKEFMRYYWNSPDLTFQAGNTRILGWDALLARYQKNYPSGGMGQLEFKDISVKILSKDLAYVLGRYHLTYDNKPPAQGLFTILLKKSPEGWLIFHDHSSS